MQYYAIALTKSEVRSQPTPNPSQEGKSEVVFVTGIYAPLQKYFALKGGGLNPIILVIFMSVLLLILLLLRQDV